jgi:pimeloyl-ACP methyl ester carboxylesterase
MSHVLLLPGAGLGPWIWDDVVPLLNAECEALALQPTIAESAAMVRAKLRADSVVIAHSFSAQVAMAVEAKAILVGGVVQENGKAFLTNIPLPQRLLLGLYIRMARNGVKLPAGLVEHEYCNDLDEVTTALVLARVRPESRRLYLDAVQWAPRTAPIAYVKLLADRSVPPDQQSEMIRRVGASRVEMVNSGHLPMLSRPRELAVVLNALLA